VTGPCEESPLLSGLWKYELKLLYPTMIFKKQATQKDKAELD